MPGPIVTPIYKHCIICGRKFRLYRIGNLCCSHKCSAANWMKNNRVVMRLHDRLRDPEHMRKRRKNHYRRHAEEIKRKRRAFYRAHPEVNRAHNAVRKAIQYGRLIRPSRCELCNVRCKPQAHHSKGYSEEHKLHVIFVCRPCHNAQHPRS